MEINNITLPWAEWKVEKLLGRGSFGEVYQVVRNELGTSMRAAIKIIHIPMDDFNWKNWKTVEFQQDPIWINWLRILRMRLF